MKPKLRFQGFHDDWEEKKLGEIGNTFTGLSGKIKEDFGHGDAKFITFVNVLNNTIAKCNGLDNIEIDKKQNEVKYGDIMFTTSSETPEEVGMSSLWLGKDSNIYLNSFCFGYRLNDDVDISYHYLAYLLRNQNVRKQFIKLAQGISRYNISKTKVMDILISIPSLPEQEKIGAFLSQLDDRIEKQEQKIALLKKRKKGWMQQLFSQTIRFKDENGQDYPAWEEKKINDIYNITRGKVLSKKEIQEMGRYPVYSSQTLNHGLLGYYDHYLFENAITWTTDGANAGTVNYREGKFYCTNVCGVLLNDEGYSNQCMSELLNSIAFKHVSRVGNPKLMNNVMSEIIIPVPSLPEQEKIAEFLSKQDELIEKEEEKLSLLKAQKKGLLQQMFV